MTFSEKIASDLECMRRILEKLRANGANDRAIATLEGMIHGTEFFINYKQGQEQ